MSNRNAPLKVEVKRGVLTIMIGVDRLAFCAEEAPFANPYDEKKADWVRRLKVTDPLDFARDVRSEMLREREDGSNLLTDLLDKAYENAVDQGSISCIDPEEK